MSTTLKVGILRLGRVAGKTKFALIDEADIPIVEKYAVEGRVEVDKNGQGAAIHAFAFDCVKGRKTSQKLQDILWEKRRGGIAPGWKVVHTNQVTMDNRQENLCLVRESDLMPAVAEETTDTMPPPNRKNAENSLYWLTVQQLMNDPSEHRLNEKMCTHCFDSDGHIISGTEESLMYYECHYAPCSKMERDLREFSICGRCQFVRYCGQRCQEKDWPMHKYFCRERKASVVCAKTGLTDRDHSPDR
ncbi:zinc finger MYND domain-containing protein 19-like [Littorina saxatilis]|uniref:MYND-type domain-containing protein n=1 Tax=Littorina saxatilis TaxID=31220 RepID=A0AAN9G6D4_9CAEN